MLAGRANLSKFEQRCRLGEGILSNLVNLVGRESELWPNLVKRVGRDSELWTNLAKAVDRESEFGPNLAKVVGRESECGPIWPKLSAGRVNVAQFGQS